ncbi:MAG: acyl-CoA dehydrogenase family protein [Burkholderiaceae bacterium]
MSTTASSTTQSGDGWEFLSEDLRMTRELAQRLARGVLAPTAAERDRTASWPTQELKALGDAGLMGILVPEADGGAGMRFTAYCLVIEELAQADCGVSTIVHVHNTNLQAIARHGTDAQKRRFLPEGVRGERICAALLTEPQAGSDTAAFRTSARADGDGFVISGTKQFISNGSEAGIALIHAITDPAAGKRGATFFVTDPRRSGYEVARVEDKMGQRSAHVAQIRLDDLRVRGDEVLGEVGGGYKIVMSMLSDGRVAIAAQAVGVAQAALDAATRYARERIAYGRPIIELQAVGHRLAEMAAQVAVARQYYLHAARLIEAGLPCAKEAAIAKLFASEMAERVCSDALQVHGGYGYLRDFPVERYCRDVRVTKIYEGTSDIQRLIISRAL